MPCSTVSMDIYWNGIATPLFIFVIANGIMALFSQSLTSNVSIGRFGPPSASVPPPI